jgi:hypothetical protein
MKIAFIAMMCLSFSTMAQSPWIHLGEKNGVTVSYRFVQCEQFSPDMPLGIHFKWENTNPNQVEVSFKPAMVYDGVCANCDLNEHEHFYEFSLGPNATLSAECAAHNPRHLQLTAIYDNGTKRMELTDIYILNLEVNKVKHIVSRQEFDNMPEDKKRRITNSPDLYIIE